MGPINPNIHGTFPPPVMEARRWIAGKSFPEDRPLIALSQAAPVDPPPDALARAMEIDQPTVNALHMQMGVQPLYS